MPGLDEMKQELVDTDEEFRRLYEDHQHCEGRLNEIRERSLLSEQDELEAKQIKRHKLFLKDRMEAILRDYRDSRVSA